MSDLRRAILDALADDGDTFTDPAGNLWRLRVVPDECWQITDEDYWGTFAPVTYSRTTGQALPRPAGFDGRALKLSTRGDAWWWQPPADAADLDAMRRQVLDLLAYGASGVIIERCEGVDFYGRPVVAAAASLWAVELAACHTWADHEATLRDVVGGLLDELMEVTV